MNFYFAGKIEKYGWRETIINTNSHSHSPLRNAIGDPDSETIFDPGVYPSGKWPTIPLPNGHLYVGPFFIGCDHGCYHGPRQHGNGVDGGGCYPDDTERYIRQLSIHELCLWTIVHRTTTMFVWLDSTDAYGTFSEIAFAAAHKKKIWIATNKIEPELWFVYHFAHAFRVAETPLEAWQGFHSDGRATTYNQFVEEEDLNNPRASQEEPPPAPDGSIWDYVDKCTSDRNTW